MAFSVNQLCLRTSQITGMTDYGAAERLLMEEWVNEALNRVFQDTQCVVTEVNVTLTAGEPEYALDRGVLTVLEYAQTENSPTSKLTSISAAEMLERRHSTGTGTPRWFCVFGGNLLNVNPTPEAADVIKFYAVPVPDVVTANDDIFVTGLPTYGQRAVECYMNARGFEYNRDFNTANYWNGEYTIETGKMKIAQRRQGGRTLPASRIGYPDFGIRSSRNDVYPNQNA